MTEWISLHVQLLTIRHQILRMSNEAMSGDCLYVNKQILLAQGSLKLGFKNTKL